MRRIAVLALALLASCTRGKHRTEIEPAPEELGDTASTAAITPDASKTFAPLADAPLDVAPVAHGLAGDFTWIERCGPNGASGTITFAAGGASAKVSIHGYQFDVEGEAVAVDTATPGVRALVLVSLEYETSRKVGDTLLRYRLRKDGALEAFDPPGNCELKSGVIWPSHKAPKLVRKKTVFRCPGGATPADVRGGCTCEDSIIHNPCSVGGENPQVIGKTCVFDCWE